MQFSFHKYRRSLNRWDYDFFLLLSSLHIFFLNFFYFSTSFGSLSSGSVVVCMSSTGMADGIRFAGSVLSEGIISSISPSNGCGCVAPSFTGADSFAGDVFDALIGSLSPCGTSSFPLILWPWSRCFLLSSSNAMLSDGAVVVGTAVVVGFSIVVVATVVETTVILLLFIVFDSSVVASIGRCVGGIQGCAGTIFVLQFQNNSGI